jgi:hypothetical protein
VTYYQIAAKLDCRLCDVVNGLGMLDSCPFTDEEHGPGRVRRGSDVIHWRDRRVTKSGIRRFLMLVARLENNTGPDWWALWQQIEWARRKARFPLRVEIPVSLWREDQARLAAKLAAAPPIFDDTPDTVLLTREKERALRWTRSRGVTREQG